MIATYQVGKRICTTASAYLHHAHLMDGGLVVVKQPRADTPRPVQLSRFKREYDLLQSLDIAGIVKPVMLVEEQTLPVMVLEYFDGESLDAFLDRQHLDIPTCLRLGSQLAHILADLHAAGIVHRDIRPANLWLAPQQNILLLDLNLATNLREVSAGDSDAVGDWAYLSPEQTRRINRPVDYRTDLYSLGMTLYRMLTGKLPFTAEDPLEWTHCHVARIPPSPCDLVTSLPTVMSDLVLKLLAKLPEERYQSMRGVQVDLEKCWAQWQANGDVAPFPLGEQDFSDRFLIPRKLYGREREVASLLNAFTDMTVGNQPVLVTVCGYSGIGKSALVDELRQPIVREHGYFISGKFDQYSGDIPYATLTQAFRELIRQLLAESDTHIADWRRAIQEAVGVFGQLIVDILPQIELLIGKQAAVPALPLTEAQHRFRRVFRQFVGVFAQRAHPLVLFLDDLQWADAASLQLVESLLTHPDTRYLLVIAAYRDNEVGAAHPLLLSLKAIREGGIPVKEIRLGPLPIDALNELIADTLHISIPRCAPLTQLIFAKTEGNPFFFTQFLAALHREGLLQPDVTERSWRWDLAHIQGQDFADNVVELMLGRLRRLPTSTQQALRLAACLGNRFTLKHLALVGEMDITTLEERLAAASSEGLILTANGIGKFLHDRVQQAAYSLIPERQRSAVHLHIGRLLVRHLGETEIAEYLFDVTNQLNRGAGLVRTRQEKELVAELNLRAGRKTKASTAYASACGYLAAGMALLDESEWEQCYRLMFDLWLERAYCEFLSGHFDEAMGMLTSLLQRRLPKLDWAAACNLKVLLHVVKSENLQALDAALACLRLFGMDLPAHPSREQIQDEYDMVWRNMRGRPIDSLVDMPPMTDLNMQTVMRTLAALSLPAAFTDMNLVHLLFCRMVNLSLQHGVSSESAYGYAAFQVQIMMLFHRYHEAFRFTQLACALVEKHNFVAEKAKVYYFSSSAAIWVHPLSSSTNLLQACFHAAIEAGDITFACYSRIFELSNMFAVGDSLDNIWRESEKNLDFARQVKFRDVEDAIISQQRFIAAMQGRTSALSRFSDSTFDEEAFETQPTIGRMPQVFCWYWALKMEACFLAGDYTTALEAAGKTETLLWSVAGLISLLYYHYYTALTIAAVYHTTPLDGQRVWREQLAAHQDQLREWADSCPSTFEDKYALVSAEIARLDGRELDAMRLYQQAARSAHDNGFAHNEGIAYECAAAFYRARGFDIFADAYLRQACDCFARWGANGKVAQLEARYPALRAQSAAAFSPAVRDGAPQLDMLSVAKASQAISGRIVLDELVDTLLRIALENAGAQTGCLLLARDDELRLAADAGVEQQTVRVRRHLDSAASVYLLPPASILNYVRRSREQVLLSDATQPHAFSSDDYFAGHHPKSILCLPIMRQTSLLGVLYLENSLVTHAFTRQRLDVLELLACQAAISLENALLYTHLQQENSERKRTEERLREREARIRRLVESNIIGIAFCDMQGGVNEANDAFLRMIGYSHDDLVVGKIRWTDLTPHEYHADDARIATELLRCGVFTEYEKEFIRKDGSRIPVLIGGALFEGSQEDGVMFVLDVSERKRAEQALRQAHDDLERRVRERTAALDDTNRRLQAEIVERRQAETELAQRSQELARSNAELEQLAYVASHDLQEPLRMVASYLQLLEQRYESRLDSDAHEFIGFAVDGAKRMQALINDLLTYSRVGTRAAPGQPTDCAAVLTTVLHSLRLAIDESETQIVCERLPVVMADATQLTQLFQNLLANALKFRHKLRPTRISVSAEAENGCWRFSVRDNGIGIAPEYFERIFVMFQRLHGRRAYPGTGMGLAICKKIVERHGGRLWVESVPDQGSTFYFTLPRAEKETQ